ncbi:YciI family protein [Ilumatobacter sp.]|uniref:YciI family protein n=1 Tax=Ilumatobacter sp. TaxID=1967498 RepID=UPI003AF6294F
MKYLLLLTVPGPIDDVPDPDDAEARATMARYAALRGDLEVEGVWCGGEALQPAAMATGVRRRDGRIVLSEGPFVETSDQLIGYFLVDCDDLDHAVEVAARIPAVDDGAIEVRPIWDYEAQM